MIAGAAVGGRLASLDVLDLVLQAGLIVKLVLLLLGALSIISWALIYFKWRELRRADQDSEAFLEVYREGSFEGAHRASRDYPHSPLAAVFLSGYAEMNRMTKASGSPGSQGLNEAQLESLGRRVAWCAAQEAQRLERGLSFLATTGSAAPFIGLFGTVVGIINAFSQIGRAGSASLAVVAPGIAEALIATAIGLFTAIPATIFYNYFVGAARPITSALDLFSAEFETDYRRESARGPAVPRALNG